MTAVRTTTEHQPVPAHARQIAAHLSALFDRDVEIVHRLNDAHHRLHNANERLRCAPAPDAVQQIHSQIWFASESMTQIRVLISPHLRGFRHDQQEGLDDRAGTFSRQRRGPSSEAVSLAFAEV